jgi:hypothetical protein
MDIPHQQPEGELIDRLRKSRLPKMSATKAANLAGMSEGWWRQLIKGHQARNGLYIPAVAADDTLARMAAVVGATPEQLEDVGRDGAAVVLRALLSNPPSNPSGDGSSTASAVANAEASVSEAAFHDDRVEFYDRLDAEARVFRVIGALLLDHLEQMGSLSKPQLGEVARALTHMATARAEGLVSYIEKHPDSQSRYAEGITASMLAVRHFLQAEVEYVPAEEQMAERYIETMRRTFGGFFPGESRLTDVVEAETEPVAPAEAEQAQQKSDEVESTIGTKELGFGIAQKQEPPVNRNQDSTETA